MDRLKRCACGAFPEKLIFEEPNNGSNLAYVHGDCKCTWQIEFKIEHFDVEAVGEEAWKGARRGHQLKTRDPVVDYDELKEIYEILYAASFITDDEVYNNLWRKLVAKADRLKCLVEAYETRKRRTREGLTRTVGSHNG